MPASKENFSPTIKRKFISTPHLEYKGNYLARLRALYAGGSELLQNNAVMSEIFPRHRQEPFEVYQERRKRALYIAHPSAIVDFITASLAADPVMMKLDGKEELPDWYKILVNDVSPPGGDKMELSTFAREQATEMLVARVAWARVDMPKEGEFASLGEQVRSGNLDAYVVPIKAEAVINWKRSSTGELVWVVLSDSDTPQESWASERAHIVDTWTVWTANAWAKYQSKRKIGEPVDNEANATLIDSGDHEFGRVPVACTAIPKGLWAMDTLESPAREHLNKRSALAWAEFQSLLPELYEFKGPEESAEPTAEVQQDEGRTTNQPRGPGFVQERGHQDSASWIGPDSAPFKEARISLAELRDDMHRVMHMMAMSVNQNATALGRSADSKKQDQSSTNIVLKALGQYIREHLISVFDMVSRGRQDKPMVGKWTAEGASQFESDSGDAIIGRAELLTAVPVKSPTFQRDVQLGVAKAWYGERGSDPKKLEAIEKELQENVTLDSMDPEVPKFDKPAKTDAPGEPAAGDKEKEDDSEAE